MQFAEIAKKCAEKHHEPTKKIFEPDLRSNILLDSLLKEQTRSNSNLMFLESRQYGPFDIDTCNIL